MSLRLSRIPSTPKLVPRLRGPDLSHCWQGTIGRMRMAACGIAYVVQDQARPARCGAHQIDRVEHWPGIIVRSIHNDQVADGRWWRPGA
eukprot:5218422-Prymnesium_polylepis.2